MKNFSVHFLRNFAVDVEEIWYVATTCCFVEAHAIFFCEPICFKLGKMIDMTTLYSFIPVWITLIFTEDHRVILL